jgi:hypothetical protein
MAPFNKGDRVRIKSLTDVDDRSSVILSNSEAILEGVPEVIGRTAIVTEPAINDYYDCLIQMESPVGALGNKITGYGSPPILAILYCDLEIVK